MAKVYRADDGLRDGGAGCVRDIHGQELPPEEGVIGGIAAAAATVSAESQSSIQSQRCH